VIAQDDIASLRPRVQEAERKQLIETITHWPRYCPAPPPKDSETPRECSGSDCCSRAAFELSRTRSCGRTLDIMTVRRLLGAMCTVVIGVGGLLVASGGAAATAPLRVIPSCSRLVASPVVYRSRFGEEVVHRAAVRGDGGLQDWACPPSGGASASPLGTVFGGGFAPGVRVGDFVSFGPWLVDLAASRRGWTLPFHSGARAGRRVHDEVELTDVADGAAAKEISGARVQLHLSVAPAHDGEQTVAVAWTQAASGSLTTLKFLTVRDDTGHQGAASGITLNPPVTGRIDPRSIRLAGLRVRFIEDGRHRTLTLGA
jgi:hypothetical protein